MCLVALDIEVLCVHPSDCHVSGGAHMAPGRTCSSSSIIHSEAYGGFGHMAPTCCQKHAAGVVGSGCGKLSRKLMTFQ